jgi:hypothetical protein
MQRSRRLWVGNPGGYATPRCVCVNAVDKGVSGRFGVPLGLARGKKAVDTPRLRSGQEGLMAPGDCGNRFSGGEKEGVEGDTVQQNLVLAMAAFVAAYRSPWRPSFAE